MFSGNNAKVERIWGKSRMMKKALQGPYGSRIKLMLYTTQSTKYCMSSIAAEDYKSVTWHSLS